jgi:hypothetical protein
MYDMTMNRHNLPIHFCIEYQAGAGKARTKPAARPLVEMPGVLLDINYIV